MPQHLESIIEAAEEAGCNSVRRHRRRRRSSSGSNRIHDFQAGDRVPVGGKVPLDSLLSIVQMPRACLLQQLESIEDNAGALAVQILASSDSELSDSLCLMEG